MVIGRLSKQGRVLKETIAYNCGKGKYCNWVVAENSFTPEHLGKFETIFTLGNGYMGLRGATEEHYIGETRGCYVAGLFDEFPGEVTELVNIPDWIGIEITLAGERFNLNRGRVISYKRILNLKDGQMDREVEWQSPAGKITKLVFKRFVSMDELHTAGMQIKIKSLNYSGRVKIQSGFDGQVSNSGVQHLVKGDERVLPDGHLYITATTQQSNIFLAMAAKHRFFLQVKKLYEEIYPKGRIEAVRRQLFLSSEYKLKEKEELILEKLIAIYTSRDLEFKDEEDQGLKEKVVAKTLATVKKASRLGYERLFNQHRRRWHKLWEQMDIQIEGPDFDQLAVRFAQFHLLQMAPTHDSKLSVAAKGLSGQGYRGHVFWDTEIFILPFFIYTFPEIARNLLLYRYRTLEGARKKARDNGYRGAMYAWESALTGKETTPKYGGLDIKTGKPIRIWCGEIEQHITADVAYAIWQYFQATHDYDFMYNYGTEILLETARFWAGRVEYNRERDRFEIHDVIGPDEYGEHVDNNAFTNYMVKWHLEKAVEVAKWLKREETEIWRKLVKKIKVTDNELRDWQRKAKRIYTNIDGESNLISQFDGFMEKKEIDLSVYHSRVEDINQYLNWEEINNSQVLKQADVVMLLYLLGDQFSREVKRVNWEFYEPKTLHNSSLSPSIHAILATDIGDLKKAYKYFQRASRIDLGEDMNSCDDGLHAASLGGIWQVVVNGFAGLRVINGELKITPKLPEEWQKLKFAILWRGEKHNIEITKEELKINGLPLDKIYVQRGD